VTFTNDGLSLSARAEAVLLALAKKLERGARVKVIGYARDNSVLARMRANVVAEFLASKQSIRLSIGISTSSRVAKVLITTIKQ
jgi:outer membrane protein OmpA-like peptidoglycan-associated protein